MELMALATFPDLPVGCAQDIFTIACADQVARQLDSGTYAITLDKSWTLADAPIEYLDDHPDSSYTYPALWPSADGTSFYSYSGGASGAVLLEGWPSDDNRLVHVTPTGSNITREYVAPPPESNFSVLTRAVDGLYAAGNGLGFAMGGYQYPFTNYDYQGDAYDISGLVMYKDSTQEWWNISTTAYSSTGTAREGVAHFVPDFGPAGLLFVFGGYANGLPTPFDHAYMFEPLSQQWRRQQVTGTIPPPVSKPCMVGLAGDNGTYEVGIRGRRVRDQPAARKHLLIMNHTADLPPRRLDS